MRFTSALLAAGRHTATDAVTSGLFAADELLSRLRPSAPGDTGEVEKARAAFDLIGHVVNHARRSTNIDGTRRRLGDDEACGRNWVALVDKCEALLAARAATGGPDAR